MSDIASFELCKELYELSGWESGQWVNVNTGTKLDGRYPAYDLGYLLRKLPTTEIYHGRNKTGDYKAEWRFYGGDSKVIRFWAATPEDAACKLAIELFKQGILK